MFLEVVTVVQYCPGARAAEKEMTAAFFLSYQLLRREPQPLLELWGRQRFSARVPQELWERAVPDCFVRALTSFPEVVKLQNGTSQHNSSRAV